MYSNSNQPVLLHQNVFVIVVPINKHQTPNATPRRLNVNTKRKKKLFREFIAIQAYHDSAAGWEEGRMHVGKSPGGRFSIDDAHIYYDVIIYTHTSTHFKHLWRLAS